MDIRNYCPEDLVPEGQYKVFMMYCIIVPSYEVFFMIFYIYRDRVEDQPRDHLRTYYTGPNGVIVLKTSFMKDNARNSPGTRNVIVHECLRAFIIDIRFSTLFFNECHKDEGILHLISVLKISFGHKIS